MAREINNGEYRESEGVLTHPFHNVAKPPIVERTSTGYWHVRWSEQVWAQWSVEFWAPRPLDFFVASTATPERISEAAAGVSAYLRAKGQDPLTVYGGY